MRPRRISCVARVVAVLRLTTPFCPLQAAKVNSHGCKRCEYRCKCTDQDRLSRLCCSGPCTLCRSLSTHCRSVALRAQPLAHTHCSAAFVLCFLFFICRCSSLLIAGLLFSRSGFVCVLGTHLVVFLLATRLLGHLPRGVRTHGFRELRC